MKNDRNRLPLQWYLTGACWPVVTGEEDAPKMDDAAALPPHPPRPVRDEPASLGTASASPTALPGHTVSAIDDI